MYSVHCTLYSGRVYHKMCNEYCFLTSISQFMNFSAWNCQKSLKIVKNPAHFQLIIVKNHALLQLKIVENHALFSVQRGFLKNVTVQLEKKWYPAWIRLNLSWYSQVNKGSWLEVKILTTRLSQNSILGKKWGNHPK